MGIKVGFVVRDKSLRSREMMEPNVEVPTIEEMHECVGELKSKMEKDKKECKRVLEAVSKVDKSEGESIYAELFGMVVHDCVDSILKKEVECLALEIGSFRCSLSQKISTDEAVQEKPMNLLRLRDAFEKAWKVWRSSGDGVDSAEAPYRSFVTTVSE